MTRRSRLVRIEELELVNLPLEPGQVTPAKAERWRGTLFMMDGKTIDTIKYWEPSGALASMNGVSTPDDLAILISEDPKPEPAPKPVAEIAAPKPEPKPEPPAAKNDKAAAPKPATESTKTNQAA